MAFKKCSPEDMRESLKAVDRMKMLGIDFIPIPCRDAEHKKELMQQGKKIFELIFNKAEKD